MSQQLNDPSSIVLTKSTAKALFGSESALDKALRVNNQIDLTVSGVVEDPPQHSTLQFEGLISLKVIASLDPEFQESLSNWNSSSHFMFIALEDEVDPNQIEDRIRDWMKPHYKEAEFTLFPLERSRLYSWNGNGKKLSRSTTFRTGSSMMIWPVGTKRKEAPPAFFRSLPVSLSSSVAWGCTD